MPYESRVTQGTRGHDEKPKTGLTVTSFTRGCRLCLVWVAKLIIDGPSKTLMNIAHRILWTSQYDPDTAGRSDGLMFQFLFAVAFHLNIHSERGFAPTPFGKAQKIQRQVLQGRTGGGDLVRSERGADIGRL